MYSMATLLERVKKVCQNFMHNTLRLFDDDSMMIIQSVGNTAFLYSIYSSKLEIN